MHLSEGRAGSSEGYWRRAITFDRAVARADRTRVRGRSGSLDIMVTLVTPAASTSYTALATLAEDLDRCMVPILAVSLWSLQNTLFVNLLLAERDDDLPSRP